MTTRAFIFAGGGTGGHLFPSLAIARRLRESTGDTCELLFLCSQRQIDAQILGAEHVAFEPLPARPFSLRPLTFLRFARAWGPCVRRSRRVIRQMRDSGAQVRIVAMGGFVAPGVVQAARVERAPVTLVNLDAAPGKANRWIARHAERVFTTAPTPPGVGDGWTRLPPIVRDEAVAAEPASKCRFKLGLHPQRDTLLISGGSQGARSINQLMIEMTRAGAGALSGWQVLHQTGATDADAVRGAYARADVPAVVEPFVTDMAAWWGAADLAVGRAGAGTVAEAWANRVPTLFLPYPYHKDEHQRRNAEPLAEAGAAAIERDRIDAESNMSGAGRALESLLRDKSRRASMREALTQLGPCDGAQRIADALTQTDARPDN